MLSIDANLLLHAINEACPQHDAAAAYLKKMAKSEHVAISEFILSEFYVLLRNPAVLINPLSASEAVEAVNRYRRHPRWKPSPPVSSSKLMNGKPSSIALYWDFKKMPRLRPSRRTPAQRPRARRGVGNSNSS